MARKKGVIKTFYDLWKNHENLYFNIFHEALNQLEISKEQSKDEDAISEALCPILCSICFNLKLDVITPNWEKPIQPVLDTELNDGKMGKRPDFTCSLINSFAKCPEMYEISFHVECKRLGQKVKSWDLNKNYVNNGIKRFDSCEHQYGKFAPSGMMVGYIISLEPIDILEEVNNNLIDNLQKLNFIFTNKNESCEQKIIRKDVKPINFKLIHLWSNLKIGI